MIVYTTPNSVRCNTIKELLNKSNLVYNEVCIGKDITPEEYCYMYPMSKGIPHIIDNGEHYVDYFAIIERYS